MANYCTTCQVMYTAREHHCIEKKTCRTCNQEKAIAEFPAHASSLDGHKHTCTLCYEAEKKQEKIHHIEVSEQTYKTQEMQSQITQAENNQATHEAIIWAREMLALPNVITLDTETTGLGEDDEIIEIAIWDIRAEKPYTTLVQCERPTIPREAENIHHITKSMLQDATTWPKIWPTLMSYLSRRITIIYNASYDMKMLQQTARRYQLTMPDLEVHCLMKQYSAYVGEPSWRGDGYRNQSLANACRQFQIEQAQTHRALADAQSAAAVLQKLAALGEEATANRQIQITTEINTPKEGIQKQPPKDSARRQQNTLLRAYGYHWKRTTNLNAEQRKITFSMMCDKEETEEPEWTLLSPLEMPVDVTAILGWLGQRGPGNDDIRQFLCEHSFTLSESNNQGIGNIQSPEGTYMNLPEALKYIEQQRLDKR